MRVKTHWRNDRDTRRRLVFVIDMAVLASASPSETGNKRGGSVILVAIGEPDRL